MNKTEKSTNKWKDISSMLMIGKINIVKIFPNHLQIQAIPIQCNITQPQTKKKFCDNMDEHEGHYSKKKHITQRQTNII